MNVRNEIVLMYMDLVKMIAVSMRNIYTGYAESDDIINEGVIALMAAIDGFDPEKNVKFETYAGIRIKGAVIDYLRKLDRVPRTLRKLSKQLDDNFARLNSELCRTPTDEELAESMNMTTAQLSKLMANTAGMITLSFEELLYEDNLDESISASSETADAKCMSVKKAGDSQRCRHASRKGKAGSDNVLLRKAEILGDRQGYEHYAVKSMPDTFKGYADAQKQAGKLYKRLKGLHIYVKTDMI